MLLLVAFATTSCAKDDAAPGEEGGDCRIGQNQCDEGLRCDTMAGVCVTGNEEPPPAALDIEFVLAADRMPADGQSRLVVELAVTEAESGDNYDGELLVYPSPSTAGHVEPGLIEFEDGLGFFEYISCNREVDLECPSYVTLHAARLEDPLAPIARTDEIRLDDPTPVPEEE